MVHVTGGIEPSTPVHDLAGVVDGEIRAGSLRDRIEAEVPRSRHAAGRHQQPITGDRGPSDELDDHVAVVGPHDPLGDRIDEHRDTALLERGANRFSGEVLVVHEEAGLADDHRDLLGPE